jgi:hypothetical protein
MAYIEPERLEKLKKSLVIVLDSKQGNGDSEEELLKWLDKMQGLWIGTREAELFIEDLKFSITESRHVITTIKRNK